MKSFTPLQFFSCFSSEEQAAIVLSEHPQVAVFRFLFGIAERIQSTDPRLKQGKQLLIATGLITPERAEVIFSFEEPA